MGSPNPNAFGAGSRFLIFPVLALAIILLIAATFIVGFFPNTVLRLLRPAFSPPLPRPIDDPRTALESPCSFGG